MPYLGKSPSSGVRTRFVYAATAGQTSFSGNDSAGISLAYDDNLYLDVYQNGVLLKPVTDYAATTGTSVVLTTGATTDDVVEMIVYDTFAVADTVSAKDGGSFGGSIAVAGNVTATGTVEPAGDTSAGDNAAIGYTAAEGLILTGQGSTSDITLKNDADATVFTVPTGTDDILFPDNAKAMFGAGSDLQIYHDGSNSIVYEGGTGTLKLATAGGSVDIVKGSDSSETMAKFNINGAAELYHDNSKKLETTSTGIDVTGNATFDDNGKAIFGAGSDLQIYHDGAASRIVDAGDGGLTLQADANVVIQNSAGTETKAEFTTDGAVNLYYDTALKLATASTGVDVTGAITATAASTITTSDNSNNLTLTSTDADANTGPNLVMTRASGSPADNDAIGELTFNFNNDADENTVGTRWRNFIIDASNGTEDAAFDIFSMRGGSLTSILNYDASTIIVNDGGANIDFRIESSGNANMFTVNAGNNSVMIGDSTGANYSDGGLFVRHAGGANNPSLSVVNGTTSGTLRLVDFFGGTSTSRVGSIQVESGAVAFNTSSDYRLKENVNYTWDATTRLKQLKPVQFNWISDDTNTAIDGFLAHEVSSIVPSAISGEKDEVWTDGSPMYQQIDQSKLVPLLVKTIQELEARIVALEA